MVDGRGPERAAGIEAGAFLDGELEERGGGALAIELDPKRKPTGRLAKVPGRQLPAHGLHQPLGLAHIPAPQPCEPGVPVDRPEVVLEHRLRQAARLQILVALESQAAPEQLGWRHQPTNS